jgi:excisionase family DNA binding protein
VSELLGLREVADELGMAEGTVRRYVKTGRLPSLFVGNRYKVRRAEVEKFLRQAEVRPGENVPKAGARLEGLEDLPRRREEAAFIIVGRIIDQDLRMVVQWNVPPEERDAYRPQLAAMIAGDYLEEDMPGNVAEAMAATAG